GGSVENRASVTVVGHAADTAKVGFLAFAGQLAQEILADPAKPLALLGAGGHVNFIARGQIGSAPLGRGIHRTLTDGEILLLSAQSGLSQRGSGHFAGIFPASHDATRSAKGARLRFCAKLIPALFHRRSNPMKISGVEIRPGNILEYEGGIWKVAKTQHTQPGKGGAFMQVEMKNLIDGRKTNVRFRSADTVEKVRLDTKDFQFLYAEGDDLVFMDVETYDQINLPSDLLGDAAAFLQD
ncbi:hypothetical protein E4T56_gene17041, partial [Termitomyces sp. T112]